MLSGGELLSQTVASQDPYAKKLFKEIVLKKEMRTWVLFAGTLVIVAACLIAYFGSQPAEANISRLGEPAYSLKVTT